VFLNVARRFLLSPLYRLFSLAHQQAIGYRAASIEIISSTSIASLVTTLRTDA